MTKLHKKTTRTLLGATLATALTLVALPGNAFVPVVERTVQQNTASAAAATQSVNGQMVLTTQAVREMAETLGSPGTMPNFLQGALGQDVGSTSDFYQSMQNFSYDMCAVTLCRGGDPVGTKDIEEAKTWAMRNFYTQGDGDGGTLDPASRRDLIEIRRRSIAYAASNGLALSVTIHNELSGADGTANALNSRIQQAGSMRADIQTNSAVLLAMYKVQLQQLAVMTAQLDVLATTAIGGTDIYHEDGGSQFADAFIDDDFRNNFADRERITRPSRGSGSLGLGR